MPFPQRSRHLSLPLLTCALRQKRKPRKRQKADARRKRNRDRRVSAALPARHGKINKMFTF
nr:MAG TPA: hypothetical protein [Caudoviricetes sp.]